MTDASANNKRIAKNTLMLYFRMLCLLVISLFTSRLVLQALGVEDYGIYNVVGGVVAMFSFLNSAMASATQRFLNFDLAKNDDKALNATFSTAVEIHFVIGAIVVLLSETVGIWFLNNKMIIPAERMTAAVFVLQCSIVTMGINIISVPYNAAIIAHEKMKAFAYISLVEAALKLLVVAILYYLPFDKLKVYAFLILVISLTIRFLYTTYSHKNFNETHFKFVFDFDRIRRMGGFASWNLIGNLALVGLTQGLNMLLNVFFGPVVNAARGVAVQVQSAVQQFATNFQTAVNPQITKSYAVGDLPYMHSLICRGCKFSFFMVFLLSLPIIIMVDQALVLWLKTPPDYASAFLQIILVNSMVDCLSNPLNNAVSASGIIRNFQLTNGLFMLLVVPVAYFALKLDANPAWVFVAQLIMTSIAHFLKLLFAKKRVGLSVALFAKNVYLPVVSVALISPIIPVVVYRIIEHTILNFLLTGCLCVIAVVLTVYAVGLQSNERKLINKKLCNIINRIKS